MAWEIGIYMDAGEPIIVETFDEAVTEAKKVRDAGHQLYLYAPKDATQEQLDQLAALYGASAVLSRP
jgi:hypothetical protein